MRVLQVLLGRADTLNEMLDPDPPELGEPADTSRFEAFLVSPLGILTALTISVGGCLLVGWVS